MIGRKLVEEVRMPIPVYNKVEMHIRMGVHDLGAVCEQKGLDAPSIWTETVDKHLQHKAPTCKNR